ncbi:MAG TPA: Ig-like domain repeat protein [Acidimicrobiales bacterium]|nr:Ig-like domain repeat protein [Acidimicrobiales bacterium]
MAPNPRRRGAGLLALCTLVLPVVAVLTAAPAGATTFSNSTPIPVADATVCGPPTTPGIATPYPSTIAVSGFTGTLTDVNVTLSNVSSTYGDDLEVLLVGPGGGSQNLILVSDAGGAGSLTNATFTFDDSAASSVPTSAWSTGTYKPTNYTNIPPNDADTFPAPAPSPSGATTLAGAFGGISPNGTWSLYVTDDSCGGTVTVAGGWSLDITAPAGAATTTTASASPNPATTGQAVTVTASVASGGSPVTSGTVTFTEGATTLASNVAVNGSGNAAFSTSSLAEGTHVISATYNGTASFGTSNGTVSVRVDNATTVTGSTYCNTGAISIPVFGTATPYPSNVFVTGASGTVTNATVQLKNVSHSFEGDLDVLLVGPAGGSQNLVLLSDAGTGPLANADVTFADSAASQPPQNLAWGAGSYKPVNYTEQFADSFPAPAPTPSAATTLAGAFAGASPNGTWSLYVVDDSSSDSGSIAGGWCITLATKTSPTLATTASTGVTVGSGTVSDSATLTGGTSPTGTVSFQLYGPNDPTCVTTPAFTSTVAVSGAAATSDSFTPTTAGTYRWTASYSGDAGNDPASSPCNAANESVVVSKATPSVATTASAPGVVGNSISDGAAVTGGYSPTGTVTFTLYGPGDTSCNVVLATSTGTLAAGQATSAPYTTTGAGTYRWRATYSGDTNNNAVSTPCNDTGESVSVLKATPTIATQASSTVVLGSSISDTATISAGFNPTGTVTFTAYGPDDATCASAVTSSTGTVAGGQATSAPFTPAGAGTYRWRAAYSGDTNNNAVSTPCNDAGESVSVSKASPTIATTASATVVIGGTVSDTATLSGGMNPTGTVTFTLYGPGDTACASAPVFASTGTVAGGQATSAPFTPAGAGTYRWRATYSGDAANNAVAAPCNAAGESVAITAATPSLTASASPAAVDLGAALSAGAVLTGGHSPTGTLTFRLYGPSSSCAGPPVAATARTVTGAGSFTSDPYTPTVPGSYHWVAAYSGDGANAPVTTACGAADQLVRPPVKPHGYWLAAQDGSVYALGGAGFHGSLGATRPNQPVVGMAATPSGAGYWLVAADGGVFAFGDAGFHGSLGAVHLNGRIVGMAATPSGHGYWLVAADGGVFAFGDAGFYGSLGAVHLNGRIVGMAATRSGHGYWLVAADGGVFAFGDAGFHGSLVALGVHEPVAGMAATPSGGGYWLSGMRGGVFAFGDAGFFGSVAASSGPPVVGLAPTVTGRGYWLADLRGEVTGAGDATVSAVPLDGVIREPVVAIAAQP